MLIRNAVFLLFVLLEVPSVLAFDVEFRNEIQARLAMGTDPQFGELQSALLQVSPELEFSFEDTGSLTVITRLKSQFESSVSPKTMSLEGYGHATQPFSIDNKHQLEVRELYWQQDIGEHYLTIGKQQIVWGKSDGLKLLDIVNPQDFSQFILQDFEESRIPLWSANVEFSLTESSTLQLIWIADNTVNVLPNFSGQYAFTSPRVVPNNEQNLPINIKPVSLPPKGLAGSDWGVKWSSFIGGWDISLNYLYHYDDLPTFYRTIESTLSGASITLTPKHDRTRVLGGSASNTFGDFTIRTETAYTVGQHYIVQDAADFDGVSQHNEIATVLGLDWYGITDFVLSVQFFATKIQGASQNISRPDESLTLSTMLRRHMYNETLSLEVLNLFNLNDEDGLFRGGAKYEWSDNLQVFLGLDVFYGDVAGLFGQFKQNDRVEVGMIYTF